MTSSKPAIRISCAPGEGWVEATKTREGIECVPFPVGGDWKAWQQDAREGQWPHARIGPLTSFTSDEIVSLTDLNILPCAFHAATSTDSPDDDVLRDVLRSLETHNGLLYPVSEVPLTTSDLQQFLTQIEDRLNVRTEPANSSSHVENERVSDDAPLGRGKIILVAAFSGGGGGTNLAIALADALGINHSRDGTTTYVDANVGSAWGAQRLSMQYENTESLFSLAQADAGKECVGTPHPHGTFDVIAGLPPQGDPQAIRQERVLPAIRKIRAERGDVVIDVGLFGNRTSWVTSLLEDPTSELILVGDAARYAHLVNLLPAVRKERKDALPPWIVVNRILPQGSRTLPFTKREIEHALATLPNGIVDRERCFYAEEDPKVRTADWNGTLPPSVWFASQKRHWLRKLGRLGRHNPFAWKWMVADLIAALVQAFGQAEIGEENV